MADDAGQSNEKMVLAGTFWKPDGPPLFTTQTDQLEKLQAGGKLKCPEARQRQAVEDEPSLTGLAERWLHRACLLFSPGQRLTQLDGPMESKLRENALLNFPNGKEFCFPCVVGN